MTMNLNWTFDHGNLHVRVVLHLSGWRYFRWVYWRHFVYRLSRSSWSWIHVCTRPWFCSWVVRIFVRWFVCSVVYVVYTIDRSRYPDRTKWCRTSRTLCTVRGNRSVALRKVDNGFSLSKHHNKQIVINIYLFY